jgi:hypothetical protein
MKHTLPALLFLCCLSLASFSQHIQHQQIRDEAFYLKKSKRLKTAGWILFAAGVSFIATAFIMPEGKLVEDGICIGPYCSDKYKNDGIRTAFFITGAASALASIPFFIISDKNQKKAKSISGIINMERTVLIQQNSVINTSYPSAGLRINL